jgi:hypothetical protein
MIMVRRFENNKKKTLTDFKNIMFIMKFLNANNFDVAQKREKIVYCWHKNGTLIKNGFEFPKTFLLKKTGF